MLVVTRMGTCGGGETGTNEKNWRVVGVSVLVGQQIVDGATMGDELT